MTKNFCTFAVQNPRKDAGVVDRDGLENRCTLTGTQGSNPCLSAKKQPLQAAFFARERRDENPGRVRYRAALCEAETPCLSANQLYYQAFVKPTPNITPRNGSNIGCFVDIK